MKKQMAKILVVCIVLIHLLPLSAFAAEKSAPPEPPYEKVVAEIGKWYSEQLSYDGITDLVISYAGARESSGTNVIEFTTKEETVLTGIYIPVAGTGEGEAVLNLTDSKGNVYTGFTIERLTSDNATFVITPGGDMTLPKESYTLGLEGVGDLAGACLIKGIHAGAYENYKEALREWELENNPEQGPDGAEEQIIEVQEGPPVFGLDAEYQIDEIIVSTFNDGQGALPGTISLVGEDGKIYYTGQAYGAVVENVANAAWKISPGVVLPAGKYAIALSQPEVVSYDQNGEALFYVKASVPVKMRPDFTGTYQINLNAFKTSTLAGPVSEQSSSFSLQDYELTVLDKDGAIELIGQYEGIPFSQRCEIVEETTEKIVAQFAFAADLTKLPYKAKISADAVVTLAMAEDKTVQIDIAGAGVFDRAASAKKGADHNTYDIKANGTMTQRELPPFVMTALGTAGGAGSIPGPDNAAQAAAGILFPPLVGLVVNVLQEALKPKAPARSAVRDKGWYKSKYPDKTDDELAMIMLADAMGSTDNPDEGDAVSVGDNESGESGAASDGEGAITGDYEPEAEPEWEPEEESVPESDASEAEAQPVPQEEPPTPEKEQPAPEQEQPATEKEQPAPEQEPVQEPETMVLTTSANGAQSLYVKDPATGQWVDSETGSVLDLEKYPEAMEQMQRNKEWSEAREAEIQSRGGSEHDKELRRNMEEISRKEQQEAYENKLRKKYGIDDLEKIQEIVKDRKERAEEWAETWRRNDKILGVMEVGAVAVGTAADVGVDGLSTIVPGGSGIKAGYKVLKGVAGTMAEAGAQGKDAFTAANLFEGAIKGAADAALDKMPGGDGFVGKALSNLGKGSLTMAGEGAGAGVGAALRGENVGAAIEKGLKDGAYKAAVGMVTDQIAGDLPDPIVSKGAFKAVPNLKNVIVSRAGGTKVASAFADEYAVKPVVMGK